MLAHDTNMNGRPLESKYGMFFTCRPRALPQRQGLTLVHLSAQRKRFLWDMGCIGDAQGIFYEGGGRGGGDVFGLRGCFCV